MEKKIAIYPGSFDPVTYGHVDLIERSAGILEHLVVAVAQNLQKKYLFSIAERMEMLRELTSHLSNVEVDSFTGLLVDYVRVKSAVIVLRGLRTISDFEFEFQMALTNRHLNNQYETIFLMTNETYSFLSSSLIKEVVTFGGDISKFVPPLVEKRLKEKLLPDQG